MTPQEMKDKADVNKLGNKVITLILLASTGILLCLALVVKTHLEMIPRPKITTLEELKTEWADWQYDGMNMKAHLATHRLVLKRETAEGTQERIVIIDHETMLHLQKKVDATLTMRSLLEEAPAEEQPSP